MGMKITVPWQIRLPGMKTSSPHSSNWWTRKHYHEQAQSTPIRSVTMEEDDLDHLGALHQATIAHKKHWWQRWFS